MTDNKQIIALYSELADNPQKDFGWEKGLANAKSHHYSNEWFEQLPTEIWDYCAAVGNPFELGRIEPGSVVLDLGCGAGVDVLVSALLVGEKGKVIGVDITPKMVEKAKHHVALAGLKNIEIIESSFDTIPLQDETVDVVISNGALNLTSCKESVFQEVYRILRPEGRLMFADMINIAETEGENACCNVQSDEEDWANCVAGTLSKEKLISLMSKAGFSDIECTGLTHYNTSATTYGATFKATKLPSDQFRQSHWDNIFTTRDYQKVFWHQTSPDISVATIRSYAKEDDAIIDVGCGASFLVDELLKIGYSDITLLDTSAVSLDIVKNRLQKKADQPTFICTDIMNFSPSKKFTLWHDRAVFHFLLLGKERKRYFEVLKESLVSGGIAIINTFAKGGDTECAGLSVIQYDAAKLCQELPAGLELRESQEFTHITPSGSEQAYNYFILTKAG